jgi:hypothetical protein
MFLTLRINQHRKGEARVASDSKGIGRNAPIDCALLGDLKKASSIDLVVFDWHFLWWKGASTATRVCDPQPLPTILYYLFSVKSYRVDGHAGDSHHLNLQLPQKGCLISFPKTTP